MLEQRATIKHLKALLVRAKQDFDALSKKQGGTLCPSSSFDDRLRKEHQQAVMMLVDMQEEYAAKLLVLQDRQEAQAQKLLSENQSLLRRLEHAQTQL